MKFHPRHFTENKEATGLYVCAACGTPLFQAGKKFKAGCGFPSFWMHEGNNVKFNPLHTYGRERMQLLCNHCGQHLGHLFLNRHTPTGVRYCIGHEAIKRREDEFSHFSLDKMTNANTPEKWLQIIRDNRSSESNFETLYQTLQATIKATAANNKILADELKEVDEKYAAAYQQAKTTGGSAWPEFENFVTQFERALTAANAQE